MHAMSSIQSQIKSFTLEKAMTMCWWAVELLTIYSLRSVLPNPKLLGSLGEVKVDPSSYVVVQFMIIHILFNPNY